MKITVLIAENVDGRVAARFKGRNGGAPNWAYMVDHFALCVAAMSTVLGKSYDLPTGSQTVGRGAVMTMAPSAYLAARVVWEADSLVAKALANASLEIREERVASELALALSRAHHAPLIIAAKALADRDALEPIVLTDDDIEATETAVSASLDAAAE